MIRRVTRQEINEPDEEQITKHCGSWAQRTSKKQEKSNQKNRTEKNTKVEIPFNTAKRRKTQSACFHDVITIPEPVDM